MKIDDRKLLYIFTLCMLILVPFIKIFSIYLERYGIISNYAFINPSIVFWACIPFLIFIYIRNLLKTDQKMDIFDYLFYIITIVGILVCIFSIDKSISLFGKGFRHEGFLTIFTYNLLFINWKRLGNKEYINKLKKVIYLIAIVNSIYALFQIYTPLSFILRYNDINMASGLCVNPNFLGSLIVTVLSMVSVEILFNEKLNIKKILLSILLFVTLINSQSTGPFLTYVIFLIFILIFLYIKKKLYIKNFFILIIILVLTYTSVYFVNKIDLNKSGNTSTCELCNIKENTIDNGGNGRIEIWKNSLDIVKNNWLIGVGYDNFYLAYPNPKPNYSFSLSLLTNSQKKVSEDILICDNAHNVYLHILTVSGIFGLIPYLIMCLLVFIKGLKSNNKLIFILLSGFVAYSIQAFANISVVQVAPIYYIIMGLILCKKDKELNH